MTDQTTLYELVVEVRDQTRIADPYVLSDHVLEHLAPEDAWGALEEALPAYVRWAVQKQGRLGGKTNSRSRRKSKGKSGSGKRRSSKVTAIRSARLRMSVYTTNGWKPLGDCDYDDLVFASEHRYKVADQIIAKGDWFAKVATSLQEYDKTKVRNLPVAVQDDVLVGAES